MPVLHVDLAAGRCNVGGWVKFLPLTSHSTTDCCAVGLVVAAAPGWTLRPCLRVYTAHRTLQLDDQQRSFVALRCGQVMASRPARGDAVVGPRLMGFPWMDGV